ncbi:peptidase domain containing associated with muscle reproteinration 1 [Chamberlinius hualienensis]
MSHLVCWLILVCLCGEYLHMNVEAKLCNSLAPQCIACKRIRPKECQCQNGGFCNNIDGSCRCLPNFAGSKCENRISCESPKQTADLIYDGKSFKVGDTISIKCSSNLIRVGTDKQTCFSNGTWLPETPKCKYNCTFPKLESNIKYKVIQHTNSNVVTDEIEFRCENPTVLVGSKKIKCQINGKWDGVVPQCLKPKSCKDPGTPLNANKNTSNLDSDKFEFGTSVVYTCKKGYYFKENDSIFCTALGTWSSPKPTCLKAKCCPPESVNNGNAHVVQHGKKESWPHLNQTDTCFLPDSVATYRCDDQFELSGPSERTCLPSGKWSGQKPVCQAVCGVRAKNLTVNDREWENNTQMWPWQVAMFRAKDVNEENLDSKLKKRFFCGGSLINNKWIVTASHCLCEKESNEVISKKGLSLVLGKQLRDYTAKEPKAVEYPIKRLIIHPNYHPKSFDSDIGLIELSKPVVFTDVIHPVCLTKSIEELNVIDRLRHDLPNGIKGLVSGWNITSSNLNITQFKLPIVNRSYCEENYRKQENHTDTSITANMICAGYPQGGIGTCEGHSGGPFVFPEIDQKRNATQWILRGVVSWGSEHCGRRAHLYSVLVNVAQYVPWINSYINSN